MGVYYIGANQTKREWLDPSVVEGGGIKQIAVVCGRFANLLSFLMATRWSYDHVIIMPDHGEDYAEVKETYKDTTGQALAEFNLQFPDRAIRRYDADDSRSEKGS